MNTSNFEGLEDLNADILLCDKGIVRRRVEYRLTRPLAFYSAELDRTIVVPAGFTTDWGSVPRSLEWVVSGEDSTLVPGSIIHDYVYRNRGNIPGGRLTRKQADLLLVECMATLGAGWAKRNAVYAGVRAGGWATWRD